LEPTDPQPAEFDDATTDAALTARAVGRLAEDDQGFARLLGSFRERDASAYRAVLESADLLPWCRFVCHWLCSKECLLVCLGLAGPPDDEEPPDARAFAEVVGRLSAEERNLRRLADAVSQRDSKAFAALIDELDLRPFRHLLCHWVCAVRCRLTCQLLCPPFDDEPRDLVGLLRLASQAVVTLARDPDRFDAATRAVLEHDCDRLRAVITSAELTARCVLICEWFCSWRCLRVCWLLCRRFPIEQLSPSDEEIREFARVSGQLAENPNALRRMHDAVERTDPDAFAEVVAELGLQRFCVQLCHWLCYLQCVRFCVCVCPPRELPVFTAVGGYQYLTDIDGSPPGTGLTVGDNRAFFSGLRLNGVLTKQLGGAPMEYRFESRTTDAAGTPTGPWTPIAPGQIGRTVIGTWEHFIGGPVPVETKLYTVNGTPGPNELVAPFTADGWVQVPQESDVFALQGNFSPNGNMIVLRSETLTSGAVDQTGVAAGASSTSGGQPLAQDTHFSLRMMVREQGSSASSPAGTCEHIAIDNTLYDNVLHHPSWDGGPASGQLGVALVDIQQLVANGCAGIGATLDVLFTAAHPNLGPVSISMIGPGGPYAFTLPPPTPQDYFGTATPTFPVASLQPCAYIITLSVTLLLTTGDSAPNPLIDQIAFCKG
jgi:hypothetical protein